jgi:Protein of unknown function (DUF2975)
MPQMAQVSVLPKIFRWVFTILVVLASLGALAILAIILVNPHLPPGVHFGPFTTDLGGQPVTVLLRPANGDFDFQATAFRGTITFFVDKAGGLLETMKRYGMPLMFLRALFLVALFELLRRLFRNVGRGDSFSLGTIRLVQTVAILLIASSFILAFAENMFGRAVISYFAQHAVITVSGTSVRLPASHFAMFPTHHIPFDGAMFFYGLLVLALSEVFRQGLALKTENELTV